MLIARSSTSAFDPHGNQKILDVGKEMFAVKRSSRDEAKQVLCLINVTEREQQMDNPVKKTARDLLTNRIHGSQLTLEPYQVLWLD